ncbi:MAG: carbohydrate-binding domain-containing protein, partial [Lachnospiraceae bacterium]|nr:carbohydrate-binding domain-containing protein [Lachnospiraceae bacterium]
MSTHKNIDRICVVVLVLTLLVTVAFMNGEKLGIRVVADEDAESYSGSTYFTENDADGDWADNAYTTYITLDGSGGTIDGNGAYFLDGDLVISNGGWYVLTGTLEDGKIIVDAHDSSKVWIRLNGVTVSCSDDACLRVDQADKVFLTLAEDTENSFSSGTDYSEEALADNTGGTIFSHDDLTINGSGSLSITAGYKHGIDVNDSLVITGGNITITAPQDGIHVSDSLRFMEASLTIDAGDDAVHSDDELYIESGTVLINSCYEGLEAVTIEITGGDITMYPTDDGINANGGSSTMGFGGRGGGGTNGMPSMPGEMSGTTSTDGEMTSGMPSQGEMSSMPGEMSGTTSTDGEMTSGMPSQG